MIYNGSDQVCRLHSAVPHPISGVWLCGPDLSLCLVLYLFSVFSFLVVSWFSFSNVNLSYRHTRISISISIRIVWTGGLLQWLKLPAWEDGDGMFEPHSGLHVLKKRNVSSLLTRNDSILWGAPWPRGSVLALVPPGLEFRMSPFSTGYPGPV